MLVRRVAIENVRSFLDKAELRLDGQMSIVIGPNGGGKTNLLDTAVIILRRYLFASMWAVPMPSPDNPDRHEFRHNDMLSNMALERHSSGATKTQLVEAEVEVTERDIINMRAMRSDADKITELAGWKYTNLDLRKALNWDVDSIVPGQRFTYRVQNGEFQPRESPASEYFLQYLQTFELEGRLREEYDLAPLSLPLLYLPVNRSASGFQSNVELTGFNDAETKRQTDATSSRTGTSIVSLAVGRLAKRFRLLLEKQGDTTKEFLSDRNLIELTNHLAELGYQWELVTVNALRNQYDIRLKKQGSSFMVGNASSGERELLTYLFAIFALNVRDALIIVDEPELHLHPKWQKTLLDLFTKLAKSTGNQFLLATHSPTFVSPESIQFVSRVFSRNQKSHILRLDTAALPESRHLLNIVNSQNNERIFFADRVVLVEGISDRMFFEAVLDQFSPQLSSGAILEVVNVGGKGFFEAYAKVLRACDIPYSIVADRDYVEQVGTPEVKALFKLDAKEIKVDVIDNVKSLDGEALVDAIETALANGNWSHANDIWSYIKSRRRRLEKNLSGEEVTSFQRFLEEKRRENVFILSQGALEDYLPKGHASKDLDKLIRLIASPHFWTELPPEGKEELEVIAKGLLS